MTTEHAPAGGVASTGAGKTQQSGNTPNHTAAAAESWRALIDDGKPAPPDVGCLACGAALTWATLCEPCERRALAATFAGNGGAR